jgi:hypothetical protein
MSAALAFLLLWLMMQPGHHHPRPDGKPKHDTCSMYKGGSRHQHFSGRSCGLPWEWDH